MKLLIMYIKALIMSRWYHRGQVDKGGNPYWKHPYAVSRRVEGLERKIVALLHDIVEDTPVTYSQLYNWGFTREIIYSVLWLTRQSDDTYMKFIKKMKQNKISVDVKIADILENLDMTRIPNPTEVDFSRIKRYKKALIELRDTSDKPRVR